MGMGRAWAITNEKNATTYLFLLELQVDKLTLI
jgi:hypothetical protein